MNCKLEKFWNWTNKRNAWNIKKWTVNLKSFEMELYSTPTGVKFTWTVNLKSFEILKNVK